MSPLAEIMSAPLALSSDALLQGSSRESLHYLPSGLCLHHHHLAEDLPLASLGGGLGPGLQPAQAWEGEQARLPHLLRRDLGELSMNLEHTDFFSSHEVASASAIAPLVIGLPAVFI